MNAYLPQDVTFAVVFISWLVVTLFVGYGITCLSPSRFARCVAWLFVVGNVAAIERVTNFQPAGFRMLAIIGVLLYSMKAVMAVEYFASTNKRLSPLSWFVFAGLWFGMRPSLFDNFPGSARTGARQLFLMGVKRFVAGVILVAMARGIWILTGEQFSESFRLLSTTILLLVGISLMLHFGLFNMVAGVWRQAGANCRSLFRAPLRARSLTEFWGQRWNLAFTEMTAYAVFRPLSAKIGSRAATVVAFLFSGILHELAISIPVKAGYGLPLLYFSIHAMGTFIEHRLQAVGKPIDQNVLLGRIWTIAWLVIPIPILFHMPFLNGCILPLIGIEK